MFPLRRIPARGISPRRVPIASIAAVVAALTVGTLAGCAPAQGAGSSGGTGTAASGSSASSGKASCDEFLAPSFSGLLKVPVGKPYVAGSDSAGGITCWYGVGKNAGVTGSKVETLGDDNILITTIGFDGLSQYKHFTGTDVNINAVIPIDGIGDKAAYNVSELSGGAPQLYAYRGEMYCGIQLSVDASELVDSAAPAIAKDEGALCQNAFAKH